MDCKIKTANDGFSTLALLYHLNHHIIGHCNEWYSMKYHNYFENYTRSGLIIISYEISIQKKPNSIKSLVIPRHTCYLTPDVFFQTEALQSHPVNHASVYLIPKFHNTCKNDNQFVIHCCRFYFSFVLITA